MGREGTPEDKGGTAEATVPAAALAWVLAGFRCLGLDLADAAREAGLGLPIAVDPDVLVPRRVYAALLSRALALEPAFAIEAGRRCPFGTFPLLDCTTAACGTLRQSVDALTRYFGLVTTSGRWRVEGGALELVPSTPMPEWFRIATWEFGLHYTAERLEELLPVSAVRGLEVPWAAPAWASAYRQPTTFGAARAAILFDEAALDLASQRADPLVAELLAKNAAAILAAQPSSSPSVQRQVNDVIVWLLPRGLPRMDAVARELGLSDRTLRRRLAGEGLRFERVRDAALSAIAKDRLQDTRLSIEEVAFLVGFSEVSAFRRAFRRWTGKTPGRFRRGTRR
jgi:AraC-like DNA-binding protein